MGNRLQRNSVKAGAAIKCVFFFSLNPHLLERESGYVHQFAINEVLTSCCHLFYLPSTRAGGSESGATMGDVFSLNGGEPLRCVKGAVPAVCLHWPGAS